MTVDTIHHTIAFWLAALDRYSLPQLLVQPTPTSWSLGQVYMHLIENTDWFLDQARTCLSCNDNHDQEASSEGKEMLLNNEFPDMQLEGPPGNVFTQQPKSKEALYNELKRQQNEVVILYNQIQNATFNGKTKHPGLGYFNAAEWLQFAEMHIRHHMRQMRRIEASLKLKDH